MLPRNYIALDVETTGLDPRACRVVEVACVEVRDGVPVARWSSLVDPRQPLGDAGKVNGLTDDDLRGQPIFADVAPELIEWLALGLPVVAHVATFDRGFVEAEIDRLGEVALPAVDWICSRDAARRLLPQLPSFQLQTVAAHLGVAQPGAHRALADAETVVRILDKLAAIEAAPQAVRTVDGIATVPDAGALTVVDRALGALPSLVQRFKLYEGAALALPCNTDDDEMRVSKALLVFKSLAKDAEDLRRTYTEDLRAQTKAIESAWRAQLLSPIDAVVSALVKVREPWALAKAKAAEAARAAAAAEAEAVAMAEFERMKAEGVDATSAALHAEAVHDVLQDRAADIVAAPTKTDRGTVSDTIVYDCEIIDRKAIPQAYWSPDLDLISKAINAAGGKLVVPGVVVTPRVVTSTRRKR